MAKFRILLNEVGTIFHMWRQKNKRANNLASHLCKICADDFFDATTSIVYKNYYTAPAANANLAVLTAER